MERRRPSPIESYAEELEQRLRHEARWIRLLMGQLEGVERMRILLLEEIKDPKRRPKGDELSERLFWLGLVGDGYVLDELIRLANPEVAEDPLHVDLHRHSFLGDPDVRRDFSGRWGCSARDSENPTASVFLG